MYQAHTNAALAAWNEGNLDGLDNYFDVNVTRTGPNALNSSASNLTELKQVISEFRTAFPDCRVKIDERIEHEGNLTLLWTFTGTNTGPGHFPATGKSVKMNGCTFVRIKNGKVVSENAYMDALDLMVQLGIVQLPEMA